MYSMQTLMYLTVAAIVVYCLLSTRPPFRPLVIYRYDERNPARRWCCKCGQCQLLECWGEDLGKLDCHGWWVANGNYINEHCDCHADIGETPSIY